MTKAYRSFEERVAARMDELGPAEQKVVRTFLDNREQVLIASATALAALAGTSDATVIRATKALGFDGMDDLRRSLAGEMKQSLSLSHRLSQTLGNIGDDLQSAFQLTIETHLAALEKLKVEITSDAFRFAVEHLTAANRVFIFGLGPTASLASYFVAQLRRFGLEAESISHSGFLLADELSRLRNRDALVVMAYTEVYRELAALLNEVERIDIPVLLITDSLGAKLRSRVTAVLPVERGRADCLSMHTATMGLLEALLVGVASTRPAETIHSLERLRQIREDL